MAENFFTGFADSFDSSYRRGMAAKQQREDSAVSYMVNDFVRRKTAYDAAQAADQELIDQAKLLANQFGQEGLDQNVLWVNAYNLLKAGLDESNVIDQLTKAKFTPFTESGNEQIDAMDTAMSGPNAIATQPNPGEMSNVVSGMSETMDATDSQMNNLGFGDVDGLWNKVLNQESGTSHLDPNTGAVKVSSMGAIGIAQVLPSTAAEPGNGVPSIFDMAAEAGIPVGVRSEEEAKRLLENEELNKQFGRAYFDAMRGKYNNDPVKTLIAYNAGPDYANDFVGDASSLPPQTQNYIKEILGVDPSEQRGDDNVGLMANPVAGDGNIPPKPKKSFFGRLFGTEEAEETTARLKQQAMDILGVTAEEYNLYTSTYSSRAPGIYGTGYKFTAYMKPEDLPDYLKYGDVTSGNVNGLIVAAEQALQNGEPGASPENITILKGLKDTLENNYLDIGTVTDGNYFGRRLQLENEIATMRTSGDALLADREALLGEYDQWYDNYKREKGDSPLEGLSEENWLLKYRMYADRPDIQRNILDVMAGNRALMAGGDIDRGWLADQTAKYQARIAAAEAAKDPLLIARFKDEFAYFTADVVPLAEAAIQARDGGATLTDDAIAEMDESSVNYWLTAPGLEYSEETREKLIARQRAVIGGARVEAAIAREFDEIQILKEGPDGEIVIDSVKRGFVDPTNENADASASFTGGIPAYAGSEYKYLREVSSKEADLMVKVSTAVSGDNDDYQTARRAFTGVLNPGLESIRILQETDANPLTSIGSGMSRFLTRVNNEVNEAIRLGRTVSETDIDQIARDEGLISQGDTVLGRFANAVRGSSNAAQLFESQVLLMAYRIGAAEGQTGQGMSNRDFDRFLRIINNSTSKDVYIQNLIQFMSDKERDVDQFSRDIFEKTDVQTLATQYPDNPALKVYQNGTLAEYHAKPSNNGQEVWATYTQLKANPSVPITSSERPKVERVIVSTVQDFRDARAAKQPITVQINSEEELEAFKQAFPGKFDRAAIRSSYDID